MALANYMLLGVRQVNGLGYVDFGSFEKDTVME